MDLPFTISPEAEQYLRECLRSDAVEGMERELTRVYRSEMRDKSGKLIERCDHEHFVLGYGPPSRHVDFTHFEVAGFQLAIHPKTVEKLQGRCLSVERLPRLDEPEQSRDILVAIPIDETIPKI